MIRGSKGQPANLGIFRRGKEDGFQIKGKCNKHEQLGQGDGLTLQGLASLPNLFDNLTF
jgi:hypothetical protein